MVPRPALRFGLPRLQLASPPAVLALIAVAFVFPGLPDHDLWKTQDAIALGIVHDMARTGDLLVPQVGGWTWLYDAPLYHWVALGFARALDRFMEFHAAARLASGAFVLTALAAIYWAARAWAPADERRASGAAALLVLLGSVGLMVHAHEAVPELATLAALCAAFAALPGAAAHPVGAGIAFGVALGAGLASSSWPGPASLFVAVLVAHLACPAWRTRSAVLFLALALLIAGVLAALWPLALAIRSDRLFAAWWAATLVPQAPFNENLRYIFATGSWFAWPAWPLALWGVWSLRRRSLDPRLFVPALAALLMIASLAYWGAPQSPTLLPLLAPLALLAARGVHTLRRGAAAALDWFGLVTFAFFTGLVWIGYVAMMLGVPAPVARNFARAAPGFVPEFQPVPVIVAAAFALGWLYLMFFTAYSTTRSVARWAAGIVLLWGSFSMLWMPWVEFQKSYRSVALQLRSKVPPQSGCIAERGLGISQAAALDYHADLRLEPFDPSRPAACRLLLVQGGMQESSPGPHWMRVADVGRPGDRQERYRLYRLR